MGDELRGENLVHLNVRFSTETELKKIQDFLYEKSGQGVSFTGLVEAMANEVTIVTAVHNIKSNKGSRTAGVDKIKMDKYLQMPKDELILLIQSSFRNYRPKPARREYIEKSNGKKRPLGIPTVLDRIIQECVRIIIEPICEARFYPQSYGFRPYRAQKHAIRGIINVINAGCKSPDQPVWAIEGDIKGCFDNINHRLLLQKLWRIGIHDKRVLKIISQMLKAGYMENDLFHATELGTPQGGILSPLLSNVYLNDFDWYVGRMYMEPHRQCKHKGNDTRRLKWAGVTPKYNYRYADDWVILTSTEKEALRLKRVLTKYFRNRMKLELSQEKTYVTDLRTNGIHFLGFVVKAERKRKTPDPATWTKHLVGKPLPDMERLGKKIKKLLEEVHRIELCQKVNAFIVATHTDREHIHNHIIYNSTALDSIRKFRDFLLSGLAVQRLSDLICLEHQLSVIEIKPYRERQKRTLYPPKESNRDRLCGVIDTVLAEKPKDYEDFLQGLEQQGYEVKRGKYTSVKGARQKRFIRFRTLGAGYSEEELKAVISGEAEHHPRQKQKRIVPEQKFQMLVDIQAKLAEGKSMGYARWAKRYNLKEMSKTLIFLQEHKIGSIKEMQERVDAATARYHELGDSIKAAEARMTEIAVLRTHIVNYARTRPVYDAYRKAGYSKRFLEAHREEITLHKAAKAAFDEAGLKKLPKTKDLSIEYAELLKKKKEAYPDYRKAQDEMQELMKAQKNVEMFFAEEKDTAEKEPTR